MMALTGCSSSSGVVPLGQDTYMIARSVKSFKGTSGPVKAAALKEAARFCSKQGKVMKVIRTSQQDMKLFRSDASVEVYFSALDPGSPELKHPAAFIETRE